MTTGCSTNSSKLNSTKGYVVVIAVGQHQRRVLDDDDDDGEDAKEEPKELCVVDVAAVIVAASVDVSLALVLLGVVVALECARREFNFTNIKNMSFSLALNLNN